MLRKINSKVFAVQKRFSRAEDEKITVVVVLCIIWNIDEVHLQR
jgi:hypothetical protein